jgi:cell division protease FtsH
MVRSYGMSPRLGPVSFDRAPAFPGSGGAHAAPEAADVSERLREELDAEVRRILDEQHARVVKLLEPLQGTLRRAAAELLSKEVLSGDELRRLMVHELPSGQDPARRAHGSQEGHRLRPGAA